MIRVGDRVVAPKWADHLPRRDADALEDAVPSGTTGVLCLERSSEGLGVPAVQWDSEQVTNTFPLLRCGVDIKMSLMEIPAV